MNKSKQLILWFDQIGIEHVSLVGGKNASLGEMYRNLTPKGVNIPNGFCVTAYAYRYFVEKTGIKQQIHALLKGLNKKNLSDLKQRAKKIRELIKKTEFPEDLKKVIFDAYDHMGIEYGNNPDVAVRSSATAEDLPDASFAGQQDTYLNIKGHKQLYGACRKCLASLFTDRAISYRIDKHFDHFSVELSIGVQKMVRSDKDTSGVMFTLDTESGFKDVVYITAIYGLGENIVQGIVNPDEYVVYKPTLKHDFRPIITKSVGSKRKKMVYSKDGTKNIPVPEAKQKSFALSEDDIITLAKWGCIIEEHYSDVRGSYTPMDIEWAKDGISNELFIVQARPETVHSQKNRSIIKKYVLKQKGKLLIKGHSVGTKIGAGKVKVITNAKGINQFKEGQVLVTDITDPDWEPIMKIASAIVTNRGGRTCHAAIISRELGIPCVVGTNTGTSVLKSGKHVTVDCSSGDGGFVYDGILDYKIEQHKLDEIPETKTKVMMIVGNPDQAFEEASIPNQGIGLARMEFIINDFVKIHPEALLQPEKVNDAKTKKIIEKLTYGYKDKADYFVERLAEGIGRIAAAFFPKDVVVRMSDFKSNEYANLIGGKYFEPEEENPMIGWRGASRYYDNKYRNAFALECLAMRKVREQYGLKNVIVMIPFCRTVKEGKKVLAEMEKNKLVQGEDGLKVYCMCEIPSNVMMADEFLDVFDGFSIGSNDLTQLTLGLDRDSSLVAHIYDERNEAVLKLIAHVIKVARRKKKYIGICGQAPSDFPEFAKFLVDNKIDSIALNPDTVIKTTLIIAEEERKLGL